jgi:hypothetical protein
MVRIVFFRTFNEITYRPYCFLSECQNLQRKKKKKLEEYWLLKQKNPQIITLNDKIHRKSLENICGFFFPQKISANFTLDNFLYGRVYFFFGPISVFWLIRQFSLHVFKKKITLCICFFFS